MSSNWRRREPKKMRRVILAVTSDMHGGCTLGLMNPETTLIEYTPEGDQTTYAPEPTASQKYLWGVVYKPAIDMIIDWAGDDELMLFDIGDQTHGNKFKQELVSNRLDDQIIIAANNFEPWLSARNLKLVRLVAGTGVHSFYEGAAARMISALTSAKYPGVDIRPIEHGMATVNGALVDYSHHGPGPGSRHWLSGNVARFYLRDRVQAAILGGRKPASLFLRGHVHTPVYEFLEQGTHEAHLLVMPSLCLLNEHARKVTQSIPAITNGIAAVEIVDGKITALRRCYHTIDITTKEDL